MERMPKSGELYRHFKNKLYQIVAIATHSETREKMVIYQALYGEYEVYARPLEMFVSEVDHVKYPDVKQKYRFEKVEREDLAKCAQAIQNVRTTEKTEVALEIKSREGIAKAEKLAELEEAQQENGVNPKLLAFLDADDMETKYDILLTMRNEVDDQLINNMAVTLDVVIPDGDVQNRYEQLKNCIKTKHRYEIERMR